MRRRGGDEEPEAAEAVDEDEHKDSAPATAAADLTAHHTAAVEELNGAYCHAMAEAGVNDVNAYVDANMKDDLDERNVI